ncbi:glycosyltransferase family 2 protein [Flavisolibacter ginsengisoli]|jgi:glycosyltransferase involved in cell wall biosynthesis|uniref:Glycosyltransferase involved in cell wall bisynthesis n=1 Tax=Flavisolibacter ginsengisoli DSM 18119 TaxID=1121884 RepID=A0A1M5E2P6_9BACT|nr:glycosyltransferase family 2 protein [Flavisolibacter ginsengisoli]SHF73414.1 Glycosyltransferase involved in cell wall bisynthesis [Flavisolibacter ginsengisoli DSM 18119]
MVSVIILTKNEEQDLPACLKSVDWCDDVHILDSGSTDKTIEIAQKSKVTIWVNDFKSFGQQRNYAIDNIMTKYEWIFFLDADEVVSDKFKSAIFKSINDVSNDIAGFYCCWKMILDGKWLKKCDNFPKWQFRILRKGWARFTDFGHGQKEDQVKGRIEYIKEPYLHYGFSKGWSHWIDRHNRYSTHEAKSRLNSNISYKHIFNVHSSVRNPALKIFLSKIPGWPALRFFQAYLFNLGFIEGIPGLIYCLNMGYYEFLIQIKMREERKNSKTTHS